jgi:hypothetical protein
VFASPVAAKVVAVVWAAAAALGIAAASAACGVVFVAAIKAAKIGFADGRESMAGRCHARCRVSLEQTQPSPSPCRRWVLRLCGLQAPRQVVGLRVGLDPWARQGGVVWGCSGVPVWTVIYLSGKERWCRAALVGATSPAATDVVAGVGAVAGAAATAAAVAS